MTRSLNSRKSSVPANPAEQYLQSKYGENYREVLGFKDYPHADESDGSFFDFFGSEPFDAAPDLTAHNRSTFGMAS